MKSSSHLTLSILAIFVLLLAACNLPTSGAPTPDPGLVYTQAAQTSTALPTNIPPTVPATIIVTQVPPIPTGGITSTATPTTLPTAIPTFTATPNGTACTDQIEFVSDVTILDNTELLAGQDFIKTWRIKNIGTCTWTPQYALAFVVGDQMNGVSPLPLTSSTAPGGTLDVSVNLKAPSTTGTYKGNWKLSNASGILFGSGKNSDQAFYVQIKVIEGVSALNLGTPTWVDTMDTSTNWYLLDTANTKFTMDNGKLVMTSLHAGGGEEWGLSNRPALQDYYLQGTFITGSACSGLDRYGLLGRAPDPNKGYVFEFSCDGHYRLYTWDGKTYAALQEWRTAASILPGANQTNVMGLWMKGSTISLYANGYKLAEFTDSTYDQGQFGLVIGSVNTENLTVSVDKVEYWDLSQ